MAVMKGNCGSGVEDGDGSVERELWEWCLGMVMAWAKRNPGGLSGVGCGDGSPEMELC